MILSRMDANIYQSETTMADNFANTQFKTRQETISTLANKIHKLNEDVPRLITKIIDHNKELQTLIDKVKNVEIVVEEKCKMNTNIMQNLKLLTQDVESMKEKLDDLTYVSHDGTFTWKITNVKNRISI